MNIVVKKFDLMLGARPDHCPECNIKHDATEPHDATTLFYQVKFQREHDRWPTWADAMAHCSMETKRFWIKELAKHGVSVHAPRKGRKV